MLTDPHIPQLVEVGPRDGLQSEPVVLPTQTKLELITRLISAGCRRIEVASFVHPDVVPQMADAEAVCAELPDDTKTSFIGLVLNERGLARALTTRLPELNFVVAASEGYNQGNQGATVEETLSAIDAMVPLARDAGRRTTVTVSVAFGDPYDGEVPVDAVAGIASRLHAAGVDEIALGDTIGAAVPSHVREVVASVRQAAPGQPIRCHFHNTRNTGYANVAAAVEAGVEAIDTSVGGYGGSPFAPDAGGNVATEDVVHMLGRSGHDTGIDLSALIATGRWLARQLGTPAQAMVARAGPFPTAAQASRRR